MRPGEQGAIILEPPAERYEAIHTLVTAKLDFGLGIADPEALGRINALVERLAETDPKAELGLDAKEVDTLREGCDIGVINYYYALGVLSCFQEATGLEAGPARTAMGESKKPQYCNALTAIRHGEASWRLKGLLENTKS